MNLLDWQNQGMVEEQIFLPMEGHAIPVVDLVEVAVSLLVYLN